jgi:hypothetical protein
VLMQNKLARFEVAAGWVRCYADRARRKQIRIYVVIFITVYVQNPRFHDSLSQHGGNAAGGSLIPGISRVRHGAACGL